MAITGYFTRRYWKNGLGFRAYYNESNSYSKTTKRYKLCGYDGIEMSFYTAPWGIEEYNEFIAFISKRLQDAYDTRGTLAQQWLQGKCVCSGELDKPLDIQKIADTAVDDFYEDLDA